MKWCLIKKTPNPILEKYGYEDQRVKQFLRKEATFRCVYCAVHENALGGVQAFHVEHYRPKSRFRKLEHRLSNLFYACPVCNRFKSDDWPAEPRKKFGNCSYPDPSEVDYSMLFEVDWNDGSVAGTYPASKYIVERLYFNRPQLILERRQYVLDQNLSTLHNNCESLLKQLIKRGDKQSLIYAAQLGEITNQLGKLTIQAREIPQYEVSDVSRKRK